MKPIAYIRTGFHEKFGIPRQSGLAETEGYVEFEPEYGFPEAVRGLEEFSHIWLIWQFSEIKEEEWSPTVRPPRLGGNQRKGVFATRSPFRPNRLGLSCVKLNSVEIVKNVPVLHVTGADMMDKTPIYDIKPYVPYADSIPDARGSFAHSAPSKKVVEFSGGYRKTLEGMKPGMAEAVEQVLAQDPRPAYQKDGERIYTMEYEDLVIKFKADEVKLTVIDICRKYDKI